MSSLETGAGAAVLKAEETGIIDMMMGADGTKGDVLAPQLLDVRRKLPHREQSRSSVL
ncbi:MAG: hypothetical protein ACLR78_04495 [Roseburia sp.]